MKSVAMCLLATTVALFALTTTVRAYTGEIYRVCGLNPNGDNFLALRTCPSTNCSMVMRLGPGTEVWTTEPEPHNGWRQIILRAHPREEFPNFSNANGYVANRFICSAR